ncbi:MAG: putative colanic acid biosynthesis acetyltransferase [Bacteroidales bacterium]|jgi:putative colanic acid biosynthesis acetyltransferase WcaF|nr:putative colanic acid biosynthesis acetyltransferase [Bacteroidales bacterium]
MKETKVDLSQYKNALSRRNQITRFFWTIIWTIFARPIPRSLLSGWKRFLLRLFGAKIHKTAIVYSNVKVYMPWNLVMEEYSCLAPEVDCYNPARIKIGAHSTVSQKTYLCAASHNISKCDHPLVTDEIIIEDQVWIGTAAYIGMGVIIKQGAVVGATASVYKDVDPWTIVGGNPAKFIKKREIKS